MGCIPSKTANSDVEANVTREQVRAQQHPQHTVCYSFFTSWDASCTFISWRSDLSGEQINPSPPPGVGGEKTVRPCPKFPTSFLHLWFSTQDTSKLPTKHVDQRISPPAPPSSAFSTPGRVLGSASPEPMRDSYTGQRIYSPTDPGHPSRRPISSAFKKKYKRYYDEASPQMPQHLFVRPVTSL